MGQSELQLSYKDWSKRVARYASMGVPSSVYMPIAQHDMAKTAQSDAYPMSDLEANIAVAAAASGTPPIQEAPRGSGGGGGIFHDLGTVVSNIEPDVAGLITSLPRGLFDTAKEIVTPSTYGKIADTVTHLNGNLGQDARSLASAPLLNLIPGLTDVANLTTPAGRQSMLEHPVSAALDLGGLLGKVGEISGAGLAEGAGIDAADKAAVAESPSAVASLLRGHVVQAGLRGIDRSILTPLLKDTELGLRTAEEGGDLGVGQRLTRKALSKMKHDKKNNMANIAMARATGDVSVKAQDFDRDVLGRIYGPLGDDPKRMEEYSRKQALGLHSEMNDDERAVHLMEHDELRPYLEKNVLKDLQKTPEGLFPKDSKAAVHYRAIDRATKTHAKMTAEHAARSDALASRARAYDEYVHPQPNEKGRIAGIKRFRAESDDMFKARVAAKKTATLTGQRMARQLVEANRFHERAKGGLDKAAADIQAHKAAYDKELNNNPPAHATPMMRQMIRDAASKAVQGRPEFSPEKLAQVQVLDKMNDILRNVANTTYVSDLKEYLGAEEYTALLSDSLQFMLKQTREGKAPLYMHTVKTGHEARALSTKIRSTAKEGQVRQKGFDIADSMFNARLGALSEYINSAARDGTTEVVKNALAPHDMTGAQIDPMFMRRAERKIAKGQVAYTTAGDLMQNLRAKAYYKWNPETGRLIERTGFDKPTDHYISKDLYDNFRHYTNGGKLDNITEGAIYRGSMKIFRTSVLYGPRHFAHVVIGGLMPIGLAHPTAFRQFVTLAPDLMKMLRGQAPDPEHIPIALRRPYDYGSEEGVDHELSWRTGRKYSKLMNQFWESPAGKLAGGITLGLKRVEDTAQTMYQAAVRLDRIKHGDDPIAALEAARRVVVNMDSASPFERTIMKQIMPFYSFTRFATLFLLQLPFDHPLRVSMLASMSNQAQEEWGTGLPQDMMSLFFIGKPDAAGNQDTVNLRNMNPFRSIANEFTLGGFFSSLNPAIEAAGAAMGINTLSGSGEMYPEISYNAQTGDLQTTRPSGDMWTAIESYVPEFAAVDGFMGLSDNLRSLRSEDPQAYRRELLSMFNIPFAPSNYNIPQVRAKTALNLYKGAEQALTNAKSSGNFSGDISRYNLIPFNNGQKTELYTPAQIEQYWKQLEAEYKTSRPGVSPAALMPTTG